MPPPIRTFERIQIVGLAVGWLNATYIYRTVLHQKLSAFVFTTALLPTVAALIITTIALRQIATKARQWLLQPARRTSPPRSLRPPRPPR